MRIIGRLGMVLTCLGTLSMGAARQDPLSQAKGLYDSASYTEALTVLNQVETTADVVELEKYRALCWLALGRPKDAEHSLEHLAMMRPLYTLDGTDASPKLVALFQDVRRRTLPAASKQLYESARASFNRGDMAQASKQFTDVILLADTAPQEHAALMAELKMLATGFAQLSEAAAMKGAAPTPASALPTNAPTPARAPAQESSGAPSPNAPPTGSLPRAEAAAVATNAPNSPGADPVYDASDTMVTAPVSTGRPVPAWVRPEALRYFAFQGLLEVVVDEQGRVATARMAKPITPTFDRLLLTAAKDWRYEPATLAGRPVKYRLTYQYSLDPSRPK
jgi:TonB family protein